MRKNLDIPHLQEHEPTTDELTNRDWKHHNPTHVNPGAVSNKMRHGHFDKQHVWPVRSEKGTNQRKSGHKKI